MIMLANYRMHIIIEYLNSLQPVSTGGLVVWQVERDWRETG